VTTNAHGEGVGKDLKGKTNSPLSGNHMIRTRLAHKPIWDVRVKARYAPQKL